MKIDKINMYQLSIPTRVYYGRDIMEIALRDVDDQSSDMMKKVLIVTTGGSLYRLGHMERLAESINRNSDVLVFDKVSANPKLGEIEDGVSAAKEFEPSCVIGFGGGSAIDAAKAIAAGHACDDTITEMFRNASAPRAALPMIAVPTTAGTGSELSKAAILNDEEKKEKGGLRGEALYPHFAIVDSSFTDTLPMNISMETGFDVLAHAMESYVSLAASPFSSMLSKYVLEHASEAIRILTEDLANQDARDVMSYCSMIMGMNLGNVGTALPHRMQYPIGAYSNSSHGAGLAALYPAWMKYEENYSKKKIDNVKRLLRIDRIEELLELLGIRTNLEKLGIPQEICGNLTSEVKGSINNDPLAAEPGIIEKIYLESWRY